MWGNWGQPNPSSLLSTAIARPVSPLPHTPLPSGSVFSILLNCDIRHSLVLDVSHPLLIPISQSLDAIADI